MIVVGSKKMVVYDDISDNKITIYDKGIDRMHVLGENMDFDNPQPMNFNYRSGDLIVPQINFTEPLKAEAQHFLKSIEDNTTPDTGVKHARHVVSILERAKS
jgi:predicted dehydrogenase